MSGADLTFRWKEDGMRGRAWPDLPWGSFVRVNGVPIFLWAFRVTEDEGNRGIQVAWEPDFADEVEAAQKLCGDVALEEVELEGLDGRWILVGVSHGV